MEKKNHNISEEKKQKLKEYQKNYREAKKSKHNNKVYLFRRFRSILLN